MYDASSCKTADTQFNCFLRDKSLKTIEQVRKDSNVFLAAFANSCWNACLKVGIDPRGMELRGETAFAKETAFEEIVATHNYDLSVNHLFVDIRYSTKDGTFRCIYDPSTDDILDTDVYNFIEVTL